MSRRLESLSETKLSLRILFSEPVNLSSWRWNISASLEQRMRLLNAGEKSDGLSTLSTVFRKNSLNGITTTSLPTMQKTLTILHIISRLALRRLKEFIPAQILTFHSTSFILKKICLISTRKMETKNIFLMLLKLLPA